jgi:hypothetical protein
MITWAATFDSSLEEGGDGQPHHDCEVGCSSQEENASGDGVSGTEPATDETNVVTTRSWTWVEIYYTALLANVGNILRVYLGRLFGGDCESNQNIDLFSPLFQQVCITSSGMQQAQGGALFLDLPANMLGCFLMGVLASDSSRKQREDDDEVSTETPQSSVSALYTGLSVGLCGCLTSCKCVIFFAQFSIFQTHHFYS